MYDRARINRLPFSVFELYRGCLLASIAHAIMVAHYPLISYEQSWDGCNYSMVDGSNRRGTVSFLTQCCIAAFRDERSTRMKACADPALHFGSSLDGIAEMASEETLQYLLVETSVGIVPRITSAFWGCDALYSNDCIEDLFCNGASLLERQLMRPTQAVAGWQEYYSMNDGQVVLLKSLYQRKAESPYMVLRLSAQEVESIGALSDEGVIESKTRFKELSMLWPERAN
jgi:hypothetical protein